VRWLPPAEAAPPPLAPIIIQAQNNQDTLRASTSYYPRLHNHCSYGGATTTAAAFRSIAEVPGRCAPSHVTIPFLLTSARTDLQSALEARQKLEAQQSENEAVKSEFDTLSDGAGIYKLVGPVLLKQERTEAVSAVDGRLEYIGKEIERTEERIKDLQSASDNKRVELMQLQQKMQQQQGQVAG
jgi:prefoldin beta subunit